MRIGKNCIPLLLLARLLLLERLLLRDAQQRRANVLAAQLDLEGLFELCEQLRVGDGAAGLVVRDDGGLSVGGQAGGRTVSKQVLPNCKGTSTRERSPPSR